MNHEYVNALYGGAIIGVAASLMLWLNGRVTGIAGILSNALKFEKGQMLWRWLFVGGLIVGGLIIKTFDLGVIGEPVANRSTLIVAGVLVGVGTVMGSGCTSGHAVCGLSRLSKRSIVSTLVFIGVGMITASLMAIINS
jgi:uncharacterized membrane protein YedE/YeeE